MTPIYKHAFEGTACADSAGSLIMMFSLTLGVGVIGMLMIMLRAAMYPCKLVFSPEARFVPGDEEDEWEEYQVNELMRCAFCDSCFVSHCLCLVNETNTGIPSIHVRLP